MKTVQLRKRVLLPVGALFMMAVLLGSCMKDTETSSSYKTYISVMHLAPYAPEVEIYFNSTKASTATLSSGTVTSAYSAIDPATFSVAFKEAGTDITVASIDNAVYDTLEYSTLLLYNTKDSISKAVKIDDDFSALSSDKACYRFFHLSPSFGEVDLYFDNTLMESYRDFTDNITLPSFNQFTKVTTGTFTIQVKKAGTDTVIATSSSVSMLSYNAYTIYLSGISGGSGNNAVSVKVLTAAD